MAYHSEMRAPAVAGMFYPGQSGELTRTLQHFFDQVDLEKPPGSPVAVISPHAGYQYSGLVAAHCFSLLEGRSFEAAVIVSPSHREYFDGISVYDGAGYSTPLGTMGIAGELREELLAGEHIIEASAKGHREEHAIEVQLPFLQRVAGDVSILPIVIGDQRREYCFHLGEKLGHVLSGKNVLLIASTDLSHYHPSAVARKLDDIIIGDVAAFDYQRLMVDLETNRSEACGGGPTVAVMLAAKVLGADRVHILTRCNSGDITGDHSRVVGYFSAAIIRTN